MRKILLVLSFVFFVSVSWGQSVDDIVVRLVNEDVEISFNIERKESIQEKYDVEVFSSVDNYGKALAVKTGEIESIGTNDRVKLTIAGKENFEGFKGEVDFMISVTMVYSPIILDRPSSVMKFKRGALVELAWHGGVESDKFNLDLYKSGIELQPLETNYDGNKYTWTVPKKMKKGKYAIQVASSENGLNKRITPEIKIKPKVPFIVKFLIAGAIGAGGYLIYDMTQQTSTEVPVVDSSSLPPPPDAPTGASFSGASFSVGF
ncbi:MAG: hypothetical protein OCD76_13130 [Reichenbachiella sp.]